MSLVPNLNNIDTFFDLEAYFSKLIAQINKDFQNETFFEKSLEIDFQSREQLYAIVKEFVEYFFTKRQEEFLQILYRVDIPDVNFQDSLHSDDFYNTITHLIIKRELLKVVLREKYSH